MATSRSRPPWVPSQLLDRAKFRLDDTYIVVMGVTGAGKSSFISKCCKEESHGTVYKRESKMPTDIQLSTIHLEGKRIHLIDMPGFDNTYRTDSDILRDVAYWLSASYRAGFRLTGIIYLHPITATRMGGTAFKNLRTFQKLCGKQSMESVLLVTTMWSHVMGQDGDLREATLKGKEELWGSMIRRGSSTFRYMGDRHSAMTIIGHLLDKKTTTVLKLQAEMVDQKSILSDTEAGRELEGEMIKQRRGFERQLQDAKQDMEEAIANKDKELVEQILKEQENTQARIDAYQKGFQTLRVSMEELIREREEEHKREQGEIDKKLSDQNAEMEKDMQEFQEYMAFMEAKREQDIEKSAAIEAELESARAQANRANADGLTILQGAILALKEQAEQAEQAEREKQQMLAEARAQHAKIEQLEARQRGYQRPQQAAWYTDDGPTAGPVCVRRHAARMQQRQTQTMETTPTDELAGRSLVTMADESDCSEM